VTTIFKEREVKWYSFTMPHALLRNLRTWRQFRNDPPLITVELNKFALLNNLHAIHSLAPKWQVAPVLKSNAYGHGLEPIATLLDKADNIPFFCVDSYFEIKVLRGVGIIHPLLVLGFTPTATIVKNRYKDISFTIASLKQMEELWEKRVHERVHVKFDTGMHRQGILPTEIENVIKIALRNELFIEGIFSHLADAENENSTITGAQIEKWNVIAEIFQNRISRIRYYHLANSAGFGDADKMNANVGRTGIALYGMNSGNLPISLSPVLSMRSVVSDVRTVESGETVGYARTFTTQRTTRIATVPVGYFEGVDRRLSNTGSFLINGIAAPLLGRVSMNMSVCDVTNVPNVHEGSSVLIMSNQSNDPNSIENMAKKCDTIPHDILVHIPMHLRRVIL